MLEQFIQMHKETITFITGGAQGFDQLAFWAVHKLKSKYPYIKNVVYVPFKGQESRWMENGLFGQKEYRLMLQLADEVKYLYEKPKQYEVVGLLMNRNHRMADDSDFVFALCNDETWTNPETRGGTQECMRYASTHDVTMNILHYKYNGEEIRLC